MKRTTWAVVGVVILFIGLLVAYALVPSGERGGKPPPATTRDPH